MRRILLDCGHGNLRLFRNNVGALRDIKGKYVRFGVCNPGGSDLIGWVSMEITPDMVGARVARFLAIEVKRPGKHPNKDQQSFIDAVNDGGGLAIVARSVEDVIGRVG